MREIKFRGLRTDGKGWVNGSYDWNWKHINKYYIYELKGRKIIGHEVIPETVGQFTGLKDKNGTEIYEGDNVKWHTRFNSSLELEGIVVYIDQMFAIKQDQGNKTIYSPLFLMYQSEVIGSIHTTHYKGKEETR